MEIGAPTAEPKAPAGNRALPVKLENALFVLLAALLVWPYVVSLRAPAVGYFDDDGIYVATAKSLAEGRGYTLISLPHPIPQTKYPILFPLILSAVWRIKPHFPQNVWLLKLIPFLFALLWFYLSYLLIRRETGSPRVGRWAALLVAGMPSVLWVSATLISETTFAALATAALWILASVEDGHRKRPSLAAALSGILGGAAFLARTIALPLLPAGIVSLGTRRKYRSAIAYAILWVLVAAPWMIWQRLENKPLPTEEQYYSSANYKDWNLLHSFTMPQKVAIAWDNIRAIAYSPGDLLSIGPKILLQLGWVVMALALLGWLADRRMWRSSLWLFMPFYLGIVALWAYPPARFVIPILALVLYYAWRGVQLCCRRVAISEWKAGTACIAVLGLLLANALVRQTPLTERAGYVYLAAGTEDWHQIEAVSRWAGAHTKPGDVFLSQWDPAIYLYTGRHAIRGYNPNPYEFSYSLHPKHPLGTAEDLAKAILRQSVDYAVVIQIPERHTEPDYLAELFARLEARYPGALRSPAIVAPGCTIYRIDRTVLARDIASAEASRAGADAGTLPLRPSPQAPRN